MSTKKIVLGAILLLLLISGVIIIWRKQGHQDPSKENNATENIKKITARDEAETIAKDFLAKQTFKDEYDPKPVSTEFYPEFWNVWFSTVDKTKKPNRGLVQVNTETGIAEWKDLQ
jgi:cytoskeletal protein RodZ